MDLLETTYTSTGKKFLRHLGVMHQFQTLRLASPIQLHIAPTSKCNLKCSFCSVANRDRHEELNFPFIVDFVSKLKAQGLESVEITGGGEPLLYPKFGDLVKFFTDNLGLKVGLITNGTLLSKADFSALDKLTWIRISLNALDYVDKVEIPEFSPNTTLGFSYVVNDDSSEWSYAQLKYYTLKYKPSYVRILNNCLVDGDKLKEKNELLKDRISSLGEPFFLQAKTKQRPSNCYLGYFKPFLYCDEYVYPCSSTVLNIDAERQFHHKYRLCHASKFIEMYYNPVKSLVDTSLCSGCVYTKQNELLDYILSERTEHEEFI